MAMGIALGVTVFATAVGAVGAMAALGPAGPFVALGIVVRIFDVPYSLQFPLNMSYRLFAPLLLSASSVFSLLMSSKRTVR